MRSSRFRACCDILVSRDFFGGTVRGQRVLSVCASATCQMIMRRVVHIFRVLQGRRTKQQWSTDLDGLPLPFATMLLSFVQLHSALSKTTCTRIIYRVKIASRVGGCVS